jgi:hypothetical protein
MFADDKSIENMQQLFIQEIPGAAKRIYQTGSHRKTVQTAFYAFIGAIGRHTRRSGSVSSVVYAGLYFSSAGRRANDEFCTYHVLPYPTHRSACPIPQKAHY